LFSIERIFKDSNAYNLMKVIMNSLFNVKGLAKVEVPSRLLCFGVNSVNAFQGAQGGVIVQIQDLHVHFLMGIHCTTHKTNLVVQILFCLHA